MNERLSKQFGQLFCLRANAGVLPQASARLTTLVARMVYVVLMHGCQSMSQKLHGRENGGMGHVALLPIYLLLTERNMRTLPRMIPSLVSTYFLQCWLTGVMDILSELPIILPAYIKWRRITLPEESRYPHFDKVLGEAIIWWTNRIPKLLIPRPQNLDQIINLRSSIKSFFQWGGMTETVQGEIRGGDSLSHAAFGRYTNVINSQINDRIISSMTRILDHKFLHRSSQIFFQQARATWDHLSKRITLRYYCKKVISSVAAPSYVYKIRDEFYMRKFIQYLKSSGKFILSHKSSGVVEYCTASLLDTKYREQFCFLNCDNLHKFGEDFVVTCFTGLQIEGPACEYRRHFQLDFPSGTIVISARNKWARAKLNLEVMELPYLHLYDKFVSPDADWNQCEMESRLSFAFDCISQQWLIEILVREGCLSLDPKFLCQIYNFTAVMQLDVLSRHAPMRPEIERSLWTGLGILLCEWVRMLLDIFEEGRLTMLQPKLMQILRLFNKFITQCPYEGVYDRKSIESVLLRIREVLMKLSRTELEIHKNVDTHFCLLSVEGCIDRIYGDTSPQPGGMIMGGAIGYGGSAAVYKVFDHGRKEVVALKEIAGHVQACDELILEMNYLCWVEHPHIIQLYSATQNPGGLYLTLEYCSGGSMEDFIRDNRTPVDDNVFIKFAIQILQGLSYLHRNYIMHGDLKPGNILIDVFDVVKLADFGATRLLTDTVKGIQHRFSLGTVKYMAPETLLYGITTLEADIWSLGCTLYHLATGEVPWKGNENPWSILKEFQAGRIFDTEALDGCAIAPEAIQLIRSCLKRDPEERPTAPELLLDGYLYDTISYNQVVINSSW